MSDQNEDIETRTIQATTPYHGSDKPKLAKLAREFAVPYDRLRGRINRRKPNSINIY